MILDVASRMYVTTAVVVSAERTGFAARVVAFMEALGGPGAGLLVALENLFPPLPSEVILPMAGFAAGQGSIRRWERSCGPHSAQPRVLSCCTTSAPGSGGTGPVALAARMPLVKVADIDRSEAWFAKHGAKAVFFGRMIPLFRSFISVPAGIERMPPATFGLLTALGSLIWKSVFMLAGYLLGSQWHLVERYVGHFSKVVLAAVVLAVAYFVVSRLRRRQRNTNAEESGKDTDH